MVMNGRTFQSFWTFDSQPYTPFFVWWVLLGSISRPVIHHSYFGSISKKKKYIITDMKKFKDQSCSKLIIRTVEYLHKIFLIFQFATVDQLSQCFPQTYNSRILTIDFKFVKFLITNIIRHIFHNDQNYSPEW